MKKTLLPLHIGNLIFCLTSIFSAGFGIFMVILGVKAILKLARYDVALFLIFGGSYLTYLFSSVLIEILHNKIILTDNKIIVTGHWIRKNQGLQFPDEIEYDEIQNVSIICANANSKKKRIANAGYSSLRPYFYYELTLKNGDTKGIYIECFTRKQRKKILDIINEKVGLNLSYKQLERKDFSIYAKSRKGKGKRKK